MPSLITQEDRIAVFHLADGGRKLRFYVASTLDALPEHVRCIAEIDATGCFYGALEAVGAITHDQVATVSTPA